MSLRSFRLIEELQRMFNDTKSSQMPKSPNEKSEEKKNPKLENSKVIVEFRIPGQFFIISTEECQKDFFKLVKLRLYILFHFS